MGRLDFMSELHKKVQAFEEDWERNQRTGDLENWPNDMSEEEWWEQFIMFIEL